MTSVNLQRIEEELVRIYDTTPDNICGMSFGHKSVNGALQLQPSVIFYVQEKKPLADITEAERIPATIEIDGNTYVTDVVEIPPNSVRALSSCHDSGDASNPEIARLQGFPEAIIPMRGGQEITMFPNGADRYGGISLGTIGFFAIDNTDNRVVGVTNTHVVVDPVIYAKDVRRTIATELLDVKNIVEPRYWAFDGKKYTAGALVRSGGVSYHPAALHIKRYMPLHTREQTEDDPTLENKIDAALLIMNNINFGDTDVPFVASDSHVIHRPTDVEEAAADTPYYSFATTAEIDALAATLTSGVVYAYSTGRTTGPKGYCPSKRIVIAGFTATTPPVGYDLFGGFVTVIFKNTLLVMPAPDAAPSTLVGGPGDSGSAVLADVIDTTTGLPTRKIVGILFAGSSVEKKIWACRIDNVAAALNIRSWDSSYNFTPESSLSVPTRRLISVPLNEVGDAPRIRLDNDGEPIALFDDDVVYPDAYWHAGCTLQNYPAPLGEESTINLSTNTLYENNVVGDIIGQLTVGRPSTGSVIVDSYAFTLVAGVGATDNASFSIFGNQLSTNVIFNYEAKTSYSIRIRATNSGGTAVDGIFTINVLNVSELAPTDITLSPTTFEAGPAGRLIGTFTTTSLELTDVFDYYLVSGEGDTDNSNFSIVGASLFTAAPSSFAEDAPPEVNQQSIRVQTRNRYDLTYEKIIILTVT
jgi:hypothetical protein